MSKNLFSPVKISNRLIILDALRGIALFGILIVNMALFNSPYTAMIADFKLWTDPANEIANWINSFFFQGKFYVLFSLLFGIGFYFFLKKADEVGRTILPVYRRRLFILLLFGVLHILLLWYGDILVFYALFGFVMIWFRKKSNRSIVIWSFIILLIPIFIITLSVLLIKVGMSFPEGATQIEESFSQERQALALFTEKALQVYANGSFLEIFSIRLNEYSQILWAIIFFFPNVLAMFLIGMILGRNGYFEDIEKHRNFFKKMFWYSLPVAIIGNLTLANFAQTSSYAFPIKETIWMMIGLAFGGPALTFVYISAIVYCFRKKYFEWLFSKFAKTGRMALTNYIMQSVIATTLFFSYGFNLYGKVNIWQGMIIALGIFIIQVIYSHYWLKYYKFGPLEWLWRTLTYGKRQD